MSGGTRAHRQRGRKTMNAMMNEATFEEIFDEVMTELGISAWYDLFDSDDYNLVVTRIGERFGYETEDAETLFDEMFESLEGFADWHNTMAMDL